MIAGQVTIGENGGLDAMVRLAVRGPRGQEVAVDTGFHGDIGLPAEHIAQMEMAFPSSFDALLADGRTTRLNQFVGWVIWDGERRRVLVVATEGGAILGMHLLQGSIVTLEVNDGGSVTIETA